MPVGNRCVRASFEVAIAGDAKSGERRRRGTHRSRGGIDPYRCDGDPRDQGDVRYRTIAFACDAQGIAAARPRDLGRLYRPRLRRDAHLIDMDIDRPRQPLAKVGRKLAVCPRFDPRREHDRADADRVD